MRCNPPKFEFYDKVGPGMKGFVFTDDSCIAWKVNHETGSPHHDDIREAEDIEGRKGRTKFDLSMRSDRSISWLGIDGGIPIDHPIPNVLRYFRDYKPTDIVEINMWLAGFDLDLRTDDKVMTVRDFEAWRSDSPRPEMLDIDDKDEKRQLKWVRSFDKAVEASSAHSAKGYARDVREFHESDNPPAEGGSMVLFHATPFRFRTFDFGKCGLGCHFGSEEQCATLMETQGHERYRVFSVMVNVENPLRLPDLGIWSPEIIYGELRRSKLIIGVIGYDFYDYGEARQYAILRRVIERAGHDSVVYDNIGEARGSSGVGDSYIVWRPAQAVILSERRVDVSAADNPRSNPSALRAGARRARRARDVEAARLLEAEARRLSRG